LVRRSSKVVIDSVKHEIRYSNLLQAGGAVRDIIIAQAKNTVDIVDNTTDVKTGCVIKAIIFELNWNTEGSITQVTDWQIVKTKSGQGAAIFNPSVPNLPTRSQTFMSGMEMPAGINHSSAVKRMGTLLIPKGKQRMSEGDIWRLFYNFSGSGNIADACGKFIYKEYR